MNSPERALAKLDTEPVFKMYRVARQLRKALHEDAAIMECIKDTPRMTKVEIARAVGIPLSTLFTRMRALRKHFKLTGTWHHRDNPHRPVHPSEKHGEIMELLAAHPRMTQTGISRHTGISTSTVHDRLKRIRKTYRFAVQWKPRRTTRTVPAPIERQEISTNSQHQSAPKRSPQGAKSVRR